MAATWGHANYSIYAERDGAIAGVLPLFLVDGGALGLFGGRKLVSSPNAVYGGIVAGDEDAWAALAERARQLAIGLGASYLELRDRDEDRWGEPCGMVRERGLYVGFERAIVDDAAGLMRSFPRDVRRMVRIGMDAGLEAVAGGAEFLDVFYDLYAQNVRRHGTPVFPKELFKRFLGEFAGQCDILLVREGGGRGRAAAAVMSFYYRGTVMPYYAGADPRFYPLGVNNFMYAELMRRAVLRGCGRFDFGRSKLGTGACEFKRGWKMEERRLNYGYLLFGLDAAPGLNPLNPRFRFSIEAWKRLPLGVTKLLGPAIAKYLP